MYAKQFVIARDPQRIPATYKTISFCAWQLGLAPDLTHVTLTLPGNRKLLVFGHPIDCYGGFAKLAATGDIETLCEVAGSYIALLETARGVVLYLDACGSLPAVFAPELSIVAASPSLIHEMDWDTELTQSFPIDANAFFPFGLTPKRGLKRLLPNHRLVLDNMTVERHWPNALTSGQRTPDENVAFIVERLRTMLAHVTAHSSVTLGLTAGYDSRALLACSPDFPNLSCFTSLLDKAGIEDARSAQRLADTLGIAFQLAPYRDPSTKERQRWLESTGRCVGGRASYSFKTLASATRAKVVCLGLAGEVGRSFYGSGSARSPQLTAELLLRKLQLPRNPIGLAAAAAWLDEVKQFDAEQILDLMYIENRLGCWASPQMIADGPCAYRLMPFNQRSIYEHALDVPYKLRKADYIPAAIVRQARPALARWPYNPSAKTLRKRMSKLVDRALTGVRTLARAPVAHP